MRRVNSQSSFTTTCKPSDTGTSYQRQKGALALCLALCTLGLSLSASAQEPIFTTFDVAGSVGTFPFNINPAGAITGQYLTPTGVPNMGDPHGFVRARDGTITTFDVPGADIVAGGTLPFSINSAGAITGSYTDNSGSLHGFLRSP